MSKESLVILVVVVIIFLIGVGVMIYFLYQGRDNGPIKYAIDKNVKTTLQRTIDPAEKPTTKIKMSEVSRYEENGYGVWEYGDGLKADTRLDLMPEGYDVSQANNQESLLNFFTISDIHITDKESPNQLIYLQQLNEGLSFGASLYSPVMLYTTHVLDAAVQTINEINKKTPFNFGLSLGDANNSTQYNELRWFIDILDGKIIHPSSGDHLGADSIDYQKPFQAAGLDSSIPWYQVLGNHDHFYIGSIPVDYSPRKDLRETYISEDIFAAGDVLRNPEDIAKKDYYMGTIDGSTPYGDIIDAGPVADFESPPKVAADNSRRSLLRTEWINEFFETTSNPVGHGFSKENVETGFACYSFVPRADLPLKVIVLDDTQIENDGSNDIHGHGFLDQKRWEWLKQELAEGDAAGQLMIIAAHAPIGVEPYAPNSELGWWTDPQNACTESELIEELHTHPNLIMWLAGHRHLNIVKAFISPDTTSPENGFWQVETSSLRDFPQEFRTFQIYLNSDDTLSIITTDVDPSVKEGTPAGKSRSYAIAASELVNTDIENHNPTNDPTIKPTPGGSYNAILLKKLTPEMAKNLRKAL